MNQRPQKLTDEHGHTYFGVSCNCGDLYPDPKCPDCHGEGFKPVAVPSSTLESLKQWLKVSPRAWGLRFVEACYAVLVTLWLAFVVLLSHSFSTMLIASMPIFAAYQLGRLRAVNAWMRRQDEELKRISAYVDSLDEGDHEWEDCSCADDEECERCEHLSGDDE